MRSASAEAPCTVGNFGPGFDCLSLALARTGDTITVSDAARDEVVLRGPGADRIPTGWDKNAASAAIEHVRRKRGIDARVKVEIHKGMPPGSGLGSSASSAAAAVRAFARLHQLTLDVAEALDAGGAGEAVVTGTPHYDDAAAALFGGLTLVGGAGPDLVVRLRPPPLTLVVARADVELPTREMRRLIPDALPRGDVVKNLSNVARIVHACHAQDAALLCRALDDRISRPYRAPKVPAFDAMRDVALRAGAHAFLLSGSGPAVIAASPADESPEPVRAALADALHAHGFQGDVFVTQPLPEVNGPEVRLPLMQT